MSIAIRVPRQHGPGTPASPPTARPWVFDIANIRVGDLGLFLMLGDLGQVDPSFADVAALATQRVAQAT
jgi:hypothetical protein